MSFSQCRFLTNFGFQYDLSNMPGKYRHPRSIISTQLFADGKSISYFYNASGNKLQMKTYQGSTLQHTTDYVGDFVYVDGTLSFFGTPEGRVVKKGNAFEYEYAIADHQGNTRVVFTSATPEVQASATDFESDPGDIHNFPDGGNLSSFSLFNNTSGGTKSQLLNGGYNGQVGVGKSFAVYPGDKVKIEAYAKFEGTNSSNASPFASALLSAFGLSAPGTGETGTARAGLNTWGTLVDAGYHQPDPARPQAHVTILILDRDYNFLDFATQQISDSPEQVGASPDVDHEYLTREYTIKEPGFVYMYVSNNSPVNVYFDDVTFTHTPTRVIQYNEYYPFGLQTSSSWTRENNSNDFLYNAGAELNSAAGWYETFFRGYDPALGRFNQVDPMASAASSFTPYNYAFNSPVLLNDPMGDYPRHYAEGLYSEGLPKNYDPYSMLFKLGSGTPIGMGSGNHWSDGFRSAEGNLMIMSTNTFREFYGLNDGYGGTNYERAAQLANNLAASGAFGSVRNVPETYHEVIDHGNVPNRYEWEIGVNFVAQQGGDGLWSGFAGVDGFGLQYSEGLDKTLSTIGGVAGAFESGAAIGTFQRMSKMSFSTAKAGLKMTKGLGAAGGVLTLAVAGHEVLTGNDNTHTWVDIGVTAVGIGATVVFGTVALPAVAIGGLAYGIWSFAGGSDWIDKNWGYRDPK